MMRLLCAPSSLHLARLRALGITNVTSDGVNYDLGPPIVVTVTGANLGADMFAGALWFMQPLRYPLALDILVANASILSWNHSAVVFLMPRMEYKLGYSGSGLNLIVTAVVGDQSSAESENSTTVNFSYDPPSVQQVQRYGVPKSQCADQSLCFTVGTSRSCKTIPADCYGTEMS